MMAIDWVLLGVVGGSALFGLMRGLIGVLASIAAWVLAGWAAFQFGAQVALMLARDGEPGAGQLFAGYALAFIGVMVLVGLVGWLLRKLVHSVGLSGLDRMLGLLLGLARGALIACTLLLLLGLTTLPREASWQDSRLVPLFVPGAEWMRAWLPGWVAAQVDLRGDGTAPALLSAEGLPMSLSSLPLPLPLPIPGSLPAELPDASPDASSDMLPGPSAGKDDASSVLPAPVD